MFSRFQDYKVLESIPECYRVLQSITEYRSNTEYYRVLQSVTDCYRVLQSVTECYRLLQSITEYYRVILAHLLGPIFGLVYLPPLQDAVSSMCLSLTRTIVRLTRCQRWEFNFVTDNIYSFSCYLEPL